jgi:hypothetical protein
MDAAAAQGEPTFEAVLLGFRRMLVIAPYVLVKPCCGRRSRVVLARPGKRKARIALRRENVASCATSLFRQW